nr:MAG TPA: hypothetical protein [Caudoviricetes sp.]
MIKKKRPTFNSQNKILSLPPINLKWRENTW